MPAIQSNSVVFVCVNFESTMGKALQRLTAADGLASGSLHHASIHLYHPGKKSLLINYSNSLIYGKFFQPLPPTAYSLDWDSSPPGNLGTWCPPKRQAPPQSVSILLPARLQHRQIDNRTDRCYTSADLSGTNSVGRVPASQAGCRGFEPRVPLHFFFFLPLIPPIEFTAKKSSILRCEFSGCALQFQAADSRI